MTECGVIVSLVSKHRSHDKMCTLPCDKPLIGSAIVRRLDTAHADGCQIRHKSLDILLRRMIAAGL